MSMNATPSGERIHIGFFGQRNAGKSSLVNAITGQELSVVSDIRGTTTDPVQKAMELLPLGPVVIIDTPGFDDTGSLGGLRVRKTKQILNKTDAAVLVVDTTQPVSDADQELIQLFQEKKIPFLVAGNKSDLIGQHIPDQDRECADKILPVDSVRKTYLDMGAGFVPVSALKRTGIEELKEQIGKLIPEEKDQTQLVSGLVTTGDFVVLVVPIDKSAPKGRLILPQQQVIRDLLDHGCQAIVTRETELADTLAGLAKKPALVITDSQVFAQASAATPEDIPLTSFSILMARYKGFLDEAVRGVAAINHLKPGSRILISEGCTHHRQCEDIGTVKIPNWLRVHTGTDLVFETSSGTEFPEDLSPYSLVIHCGACMLNAREVTYRMKCAMDQHIPFTNYGITIAAMQGILQRGLSVFPELLRELDR